MLARCIKKGTVRLVGSKSTKWIEPGMVMDVELDADGKLPHIMEALDAPQKAPSKKAATKKDDSI